MITPRFSCSQTEASVLVKIYCPSVRASDVEINVDETLFSVHINPYFLRLNFPHPLIEDDASAAAYDPSSGYLTVTLTKQTSGLEFKDLDLLAKLLAPRPPREAVTQPLIEVLRSSDNSLLDEDEELAARTQELSLSQEQEEILHAAENDWQLPQTLPESLPPLQTSARCRYGFLDMHSGYFVHIEHVENEVNELGADAETCAPSERRRRRLKHEDEKWDEEHYMADFADDEYIRELIAWPNPLTTSAEQFQYTEKENMAMLRLPRKEYLPTVEQTHELYLTLLTILFSYAYDVRTTQHEPTPESAWTIASLTPAFSALDPPPYAPSSRGPLSLSVDELEVTFAASYRRSLSFPLYRSWALAEACRIDVARLLAGGKRMVTRCLLELKEILEHHDVYYVYSKVWVEDLCVWTVAYSDDAVLEGLGKSIEAMAMKKAMVGWDLEELEGLTREDADHGPDSDDESEDEIERMLPAPL
ncbi:SHQ1-domain-containing protein [Epithele typhae]|uniref:SHQ1-domain-containing protein n=1 Tax=Epithele typhae TaxID=378194 RepID=UPI002008A4C5|nr:SHQ1-domain-containing protein [Epithele typhae]KAH9946275.1 SHQ1-domain-containing protein [Epithele typhae]